jgi:hypothetical protein
MSDRDEQFKNFSVFRHADAQAMGEEMAGPFCWNCELSFDFNDAPADLDLHFCDLLCEREWRSRQPFANFMSKRRPKL